MKSKIILVCFFFLQASSWAASDSSHASISSLIAPMINVSILLAFLAWKIKNPLRSYFKRKAEEISNTMERANLKSKEAHLMLEGEKRKLDYLSSEVKAIKEHSETDVVNFEKKISKETDEKIRKLKLDAEAKIKADKKEAIDHLNSELLNLVVLKTKSTIKTNSELQGKVSSKLLQGL